MREDASTTQLTEDLSTIEKGIIFSWCVLEGSFDAVDYTKHMVSAFLNSFKPAEQ